MIEINHEKPSNKFDITLKRSEWDELRPIVKGFQEKAQINYEVSDYEASLGMVLVQCSATEAAEKAIDAKLKELGISTLP